MVVQTILITSKLEKKIVKKYNHSGITVIQFKNMLIQTHFDEMMSLNDMLLESKNDSWFSVLLIM